MTYPPLRPFGQFNPEPLQSRTGFPPMRSQNGIGNVLGTVQFQIDTIPPVAPSVQDINLQAMNFTPAYCEFSGHVVSNASAGLLGNFSLVTPPRSLVPGINECTPRSTVAQLVASGLYQPNSGTMNPTAVAMGDVNGDGVLDAAIVNQANNSIAIVLGNGDGTFNTNNVNSVTLPFTPNSVALGRLDGDAILDLAVGENGGNDVRIFVGNGTGGFNVPNAPVSPTVNTTSDPSAVVIADLNNDGRNDLIVATIGNNIKTFPGNGDGSFGGGSR